MYAHAALCLLCWGPLLGPSAVRARSLLCVVAIPVTVHPLFDLGRHCREPWAAFGVPAPTCHLCRCALPLCCCAGPAAAGRRRVLHAADPRRAGWRDRHVHQGPAAGVWTRVVQLAGVAPLGHLAGLPSCWSGLGWRCIRCWCRCPYPPPLRLRPVCPRLQASCACPAGLDSAAPTAAHAPPACPSCPAATLRQGVRKGRL